MSILKDLPELIKAGIIAPETAEKISEYYRSRSTPSTNRLFIVFGILGALMVGLGIILVIAHNWDELSRTTKTFFAFLPLIIGQMVCGFTLVKKTESVAWRESASTFLFFAVGGSISLVSQIYNIPGTFSGLLLTWMLLCLPLIYLMRSSITSLLYILGITVYAVDTGYGFVTTETYNYWILFLLGLPHYYILYKKQPHSNFMIFHNWFVPLSVTISLGTVAKNYEELMYIAYFSLFGSFYLIGNLPFFSQQKTRNQCYLLLGSLGTLSLLLALSFDWFWDDLRDKAFPVGSIISTPEFIAATILTFLGTWLFFQERKFRSFEMIRPMEPIFLLFILTFLLGLFSPVSIVLINLFIFMISILTIRKGAKLDHLGILNFGLLIMMALVICKFFDSDVTFVTRGILFLSVGIGFFIANYLMLKKRKKHA